MRLAFLALAFLVNMTVTLTAQQIDTVDLYSKVMHKNIRNLVVKPSNYQNSDQIYPVAYLLHGWSGNYASWLGDAPHIAQFADEYQCILVFPDGGYDSWFLDSPVDSSVRYESYLIQELIPFIDSSMRTSTLKRDRTICGLSMGGHGALYLALRHQDLFGAAGSICGGVDLRPFKQNNWDLEGVLGKPNKKNWENWENASVVNLVPLLKRSEHPALIIDCGLSDFFLPANHSLHHALLAAGISHEYTERPGEHNAAYWCNAIDFQFLFFAKEWGRR